MGEEDYNEIKDMVPENYILSTQDCGAWVNKNLISFGILYLSEGWMTTTIKSII